MEILVWRDFPPTFWVLFYCFIAVAATIAYIHERLHPYYKPTPEELKQAPTSSRESIVPSLREGLPVTIKRRGKTVTIERSRVRFQYHGFWSLFRTGCELPIPEFKAVEIAGEVVRGEEETSVYVSVKLLHRSSRRFGPITWSCGKDVILAEESFDGSYVTDQQVQGLRELWADAARAVSLPAIDAGVPREGSPVIVGWILYLIPLILFFTVMICVWIYVWMT